MPWWKKAQRRGQRVLRGPAITSEAELREFERLARSKGGRVVGFEYCDDPRCLTEHKRSSRQGKGV